MARLPSLNGLKAFEAAARHMSFQKAADELNVTPSALSYQIRQLEDQLGKELFTRLNRQVLLTEDGQKIAPGIRDGFERLTETIDRLRTSTPPNVLTVSTGPAFAAKWLAPRLHRFIETYPDIEIRMAANLNLVNMIDDGIDCSVRFGGGNYPGLHAEQLFDEWVLPLVSPAFLARYDGKMELEDLAQANLVHDDSASFLPNAATWTEWLRAMGAAHIDATRGPRFNHADHAIDAAMDGAGVVLARFTLAQKDMAAGRLLAPFKMLLPATAGFYFCSLPDALESEKVSKFRTFIYEEIEAARSSMDQLRADIASGRHLSNRLSA